MHKDNAFAMNVNMFDTRKHKTLNWSTKLKSSPADILDSCS